MIERKKTGVVAVQGFSENDRFCKVLPGTLDVTGLQPMATCLDQARLFHIRPAPDTGQEQALQGPADSFLGRRGRAGQRVQGDVSGLGVICGLGSGVRSLCLATAVGVIGDGTQSGQCGQRSGPQDRWLIGQVKQGKQPFATLADPATLGPERPQGESHGKSGLGGP